MYQPYARVGLVLAKGGYADGPKKAAIVPFYMLYDRDNRYVGWCRATTIDAMAGAGLLDHKPAELSLITRDYMTADFRREIESIIDRETS